MVKKVFNLYLYCLFRIHHYYISNKVDSDPIVYSSHWMAAAFVFNIITIIHIGCSIYKKGYHFTLLIYLYIIFVIINHILIKKKYKKCIVRLKKDRKKTQKGWYVFVYIVMSIFLYIITVIFLDVRVIIPSWVSKINFQFI